MTTVNFPDVSNSASPGGVPALLGALLLVGCSHTGVLEQLDEVAVVPETYAEELVDPLVGALSGFADATEVCTDLGGSQLSALQVRLAGDSLDLRAAVARLEAAEARAREAGAALLPKVEASLQATRGNTVGFAVPGQGGSGAITTLQPSVAASYEVDLWGKLGDRKQAASLDAQASAQDVRALAITLSSSLADLWFLIAAENELLSLLEEQKRVSESFVELTELRFGQGFGQAQDIGRQRQQLLSLEGDIELSEGRRDSWRVQLATLLGTTRLDTPTPEYDTSDLLRTNALPALGVPSEMVQLRPDLRSALSRLEAADKRLAAAVKEWFPSLVLSASIFDLQRTVAALLQDLLWQVSARVTESAFDGGVRGARVQQARALAEEALYGYANALNGAVGEVHNALALTRSQGAFLDNLEARLGEARRVLLLTRESYREGATDYLNVLTALSSVQILEQTLIAARQQQVSQRVQLCRALGHPIGTGLDTFEPLLASYRAGAAAATVAKLEGAAGADGLDSPEGVDRPDHPDHPDNPDAPGGSDAAEDRSTSGGDAVSPSPEGTP